MKSGSGLAAIYTRISSNPDDDKLGVQRQEADARKLCAKNGWTVVEIFCDNDRSAFSQRKTRSAYQAMLDTIRAGKIDIIVAWHPDRLHRQTRELVSFIDLVNLHGVRIETVTAGPYDLSTPSGRVSARILGSVAEFESEHKSARIRRKLEANAAEGRQHGGSRPYGWYNDDRGRGRYCTVNQEEAAIVREATARVIAGESIRGITRAFNEAGHTTSTGISWRDVHVRKMIMRPRNAGLRQYHGDVVGPGQWEPILSAEEFYQAQAILSNPARRSHPGRGGRVHLLSTIARCGVCGGPMTVGKARSYKGNRKSIYRCRQAHVARGQASVDDLVTRVILARLAQPDAKDLLVDRGQADTAQAAAWRVQELQDRLNDAAEAYAAGVVTMAQLTTINASLKPKLEQAQKEAASPNREKVLGELVSREPAEVWQGMSADQRRAVVGVLVEVTIMPTRHGPVFDPESVRIDWRQS
jgi:DNA invertase Pin-like site-specific DNA recombinase